MHFSNEPYNKELRQQLRRESTPYENILWRRLQKRQVLGLKFRRQHGYGPYVLDFYCPTIRLCIEVDGEVHDSPEAKKHDSERTEFLEQEGITVIRFRNEEIENNVESVVEKIKAFINSRDWRVRYATSPASLAP